MSYKQNCKVSNLNIILNFIKFIITADVKITGILGKEVKIPPDCLARISQPQRKNSSFMP